MRISDWSSDVCSSDLDADLARRLQRLAERFDPDWQQPSVAVFGDVVGVQVANGFAGALKQARTLGGEFAGSAADYVVEESRDVVGDRKKRRVGDEGVSKCRSRWSPYHYTKKPQPHIHQNNTP